MKPYLLVLALCILLTGCKYPASDIKCYSGVDGEVFFEKKHVWVTHSDGTFTVHPLSEDGESVGKLRDSMVVTGNCVVTPSTGAK